MTTLLLAHECGASLVTLDVPATDSASPNIKEITQLPLASRFPAKSTPRTAVAPSGHIFLWSDSNNVVWEYDVRGKRVGEINSKCTCVKKFIGLGKVDGKETAMIDDGQTLIVWAKGSKGIWEVQGDIGKTDGSIDLAVSCDSKRVAVLHSHEAIISDLSGHVYHRINLSQRLAGEVAVRAFFTATDPSSIVIASIHRVTTLKLEQPELCHSTIYTSLDAFEMAEAGRSDNVWVHNRNGDVTVLDMAGNRSGSANVNLGDDEIAEITPLTGQLILVRFLAGRLSIHNLAKTSSRFDQLELPFSVLSVQVMSNRAKYVKTATAPSSSSPAQMTANRAKPPLGENRNSTNMPAPTSDAQARKKGVKIAPKQMKLSRFVSAPITQSEASRPSALRSASQPEKPKQPRPSANIANRQGIEAIDEEAEVDERTIEGEIAMGDVGEPSVYLDWALRSPNRLDGAGQADDVMEMDDMRKEISRLQLDMLRMGRLMKNEIRKAVEPLWDEVRASRETIERQGKEIDRLRRAVKVSGE